MCAVLRVFNAHMQIPAFFTGHHSYDLYTRNMTFETQSWRYPWRSEGVTGYRLFLQTWRVGVRSVCRGCEVDLLRITKDNERGRVEARWRVRGRYHWSRQHR